MQQIETYWGYLERRERTGKQSFTLTFEAIDEAQAGRIRLRDIAGPRLSESVLEIRSTFIEIEINHKDADYLQAKRLIESRWYQLKMGNGSRKCRIWDDKGQLLENQSQSIDFTEIGPGGDGILNANMTLARAAPAATRTDGEQWLQALNHRAANAQGLAVFDVGQGSCAGLCDSNGEVVLYFDYGMPFGPNARTSSSPLCWHQGIQPEVLLSHWDLDHLYGFRNRPEILQSRWTAPHSARPLGVTHLQLAAKLGKNLNLVTTEPGVMLCGTPLSIGAGSGKGKNDSGLAVLVRLPHGNGEHLSFLPGDCSYQFLPWQPGLLQIDLLVESHHGGNHHSKSRSKNGIPAPRRPGSKPIASCGWQNSYKHPSITAQSKLAEQGWGDRHTTARNPISATPGTGGFRLLGTHNPVACGEDCRQQCGRRF